VAIFFAVAAITFDVLLLWFTLQNTLAVVLYALIAVLWRGCCVRWALG
jgi:hypothetical protein